VEAPPRRGEQDPARFGQTGGWRGAGEGRRWQTVMVRRESLGGWRGKATAQSTSSPSILCESRRGGLSGPKWGGLSGPWNIRPGGGWIIWPAAIILDQILFKTTLVCKRECLRGEKGLGLDIVTDWFLALDIARIK
jgi:hypothetical protein